MVTGAQKNLPVSMQPRRTVLLSDRWFSTIYLLKESKSHVHHTAVRVHPNNPTGAAPSTAVEVSHFAPSENSP